MKEYFDNLLVAALVYFLSVLGVPYFLQGSLVDHTGSYVLPLPAL